LPIPSAPIPVVETGPSSAPARLWHPLLIGLIAAAARLIYLGQVRTFLLFREATGDAAQYVELARAFLGSGPAVPPGQACFQAPFYPWYLAGIFAAGGHLLAARLAQFGAGVLGALLAWDTGRRLGGPAAGLVAGLLSALYAPRLFFEGELLSIAWALLFLQLALWALVVLADSPRPVTALLAGGAAGLAALAQPNTLLVAVAAAGWMLWRALRAAGPAGRAAWRASFLGFMAALAILLLPVLIRNRVDSGDWILVSSNGGINFFIGNNPDADGTFHLPGGEPLLNDSDGLAASSAEAASGGLGRPAGPAATSGYWFGRGLAFWSSQPLRALGLTARKTLLLLNAAEIPNHYDIRFFRERVPLLRVLPGFLLVAPFALWGLLRLARRPAAAPLLLGGLAGAVSVVFFFITDRYRLPLLAFLLPAAGVGMADIAETLRGGKRREIVIAAALLALFTGLAGVRLIDTGIAEAHMHNLLGTLLYHHRQPDAAHGEFQRALDIDPRSAEAMNNIGRVALVSGRTAEAGEWFRKAITADPRLPDAYFNLEEVERSRGDWPGAFQALADLEQAVPGARTTLAPALASRRGQLLAARGDTARARAELARAIRLKPDLAGAHAALGAVQAGAGELEAARLSYSTAARLSPEFFDYHFRLGLVAERLGDYPAALAACREADRLAPGRPEVRAALERLATLEGRK
jgi:Flp pilus assembly protein TadD/4-amino-4-deoxy-L-arabinose transferase-like glycosyltransferase